MADTRLLVVLFPLLAAASWALFNIGRVALQQLKLLLHISIADAEHDFDKHDRKRRYVIDTPTIEDVTPNVI